MEINGIDYVRGLQTAFANKRRGDDHVQFVSKSFALRNLEHEYVLLQGFYIGPLYTYIYIYRIPIYGALKHRAPIYRVSLYIYIGPCTQGPYIKAPYV